MKKSLRSITQASTQRISTAKFPASPQSGEPNVLLLESIYPVSSDINVVSLASIHQIQPVERWLEVCQSIFGSGSCGDVILGCATD
jgi:hypothetical protein